MRKKEEDQFHTACTLRKVTTTGEECAHAVARGIILLLPSGHTIPVSMPHDRFLQ